MTCVLRIHDTFMRVFVYNLLADYNVNVCYHINIKNIYNTLKFYTQQQ
jgi:hypothetical protein